MQFILILSMIILCSKSTDNGTTNIGSYKVDITVFMNGTAYSTLNNHTITFAPTGTSGQVTITNNIMQSTSANIIGNTLTIPNATVNSSVGFKTVEYGTGTFSGNTLSIEFHQDLVPLPGNTPSSKAKWTGTLTK